MLYNSYKVKLSTKGEYGGLKKSQKLSTYVSLFMAPLDNAHHASHSIYIKYVSATIVA